MRTLASKMIIIFCSLVIIAGCADHSSSSLRGWIGYYGWNDCSPGATSGSTPLWEYLTISIYEEDGAFYADYMAHGYQQWVVGRADVVGDKEKITLVFKEYVSEECQQPFKVGDELFSLTKQEESLITTWKTAHPHFGDRSDIKEGIFFARDDSDQIVDYYKRDFDIFK